MEVNPLIFSYIALFNSIYCISLLLRASNRLLHCFGLYIPYSIYSVLPLLIICLSLICGLSLIF